MKNSVSSGAARFSKKREQPAQAGPATPPPASKETIYDKGARKAAERFPNGVPWIGDREIGED